MSYDCICFLISFGNPIAAPATVVSLQLLVASPEPAFCAYRVDEAEGFISGCHLN